MGHTHTRTQIHLHINTYITHQVHAWKKIPSVKIPPKTFRPGKRKSQRLLDMTKVQTHKQICACRLFGLTLRIGLALGVRVTQTHTTSHTHHQNLEAQIGLRESVIAAAEESARKVGDLTLTLTLNLTISMFCICRYKSETTIDITGRSTKRLMPR